MNPESLILNWFRSCFYKVNIFVHQEHGITFSSGPSYMDPLLTASRQQLITQIVFSEMKLFVSV